MAWVTAVNTAAGIVIAEYCHCGQPGAFGYFINGSMQWFCAAHRLRQWSADACISETESVRAQADLVPDDMPPDLQMLIAEHGGYQNITPEAWAQFDRMMKTWQTKRREKYRRR